jgi:hypothetical protein
MQPPTAPPLRLHGRPHPLESLPMVQTLLSHVACRQHGALGVRALRALGGTGCWHGQLRATTPWTPPHQPGRAP